MKVINVNKKLFATFSAVASSGSELTDAAPRLTWEFFYREYHKTVGEARLLDEARQGRERPCGRGKGGRFLWCD